MGVGTRKPWEKFDINYERFEAVDEDATLTQLVGAWINLHKGGENTKEAAYTYEELIDKFGSSLTLLNGLAVAKMHQKDYDEAQKRLQEVRGRGPSLGRKHGSRRWRRRDAAPPRRHRGRRDAAVTIARVS